ncbi:MAG: tripartite tricarboxylate transporter substrate binding protein [Acetobacteraceae bacterium]|nr:tripartite tricarboxylate transporter substrate binding protein [Acetobacteraceae bacterium]
MIARILVGAFAVGLIFIGPASAQDKYPTKPIRMVVPFAVGGATDVIARILGMKMSEFLGQQVLVDNRAGAGGNIGSDLVAKAAPDGYTILAATGSTHTFNPLLYKKISYDPIKDFAPIGQVVITPFLLVVHKDVPAKDLPGFIALVKANPGKYNYGSAGIGTNIHLCSELFKQMAGNLDLAHVPYRGSGPLMNDLTAGQIAMAFDPAATSTPHIQGGAIRPLGTATLRRSHAMPDLPTLHDQGLTGFDCYTWTSLYAPAKTPDAIVRRLAAALNAALADKAVGGRLGEMGFEPTLDTSPEKLAAFTKSELERWTPVVRSSGVELD